MISERRVQIVKITLISDLSLIVSVGLFNILNYKNNALLFIGILATLNCILAGLLLDTKPFKPT